MTTNNQLLPLQSIEEIVNKVLKDWEIKDPIVKKDLIDLKIVLSEKFKKQKKTEDSSKQKLDWSVIDNFVSGRYDIRTGSVNVSTDKDVSTSKKKRYRSPYEGSKPSYYEYIYIGISNQGKLVSCRFEYIGIKARCKLHIDVLIKDGYDSRILLLLLTNYLSMLSLAL